MTLAPSCIICHMMNYRQHSSSQNIILDQITRKLPDVFIRPTQILPCAEVFPTKLCGLEVKIHTVIQNKPY